MQVMQWCVTGVGWWSVMQVVQWCVTGVVWWSVMQEMRVLLVDGGEEFL
jgi:hypothetical protein